LRRIAPRLPGVRLPAFRFPWTRSEPPRLLRSTGVRFGVFYAGLFSVSAAALAGFLWWSTAGLLQRQTDDALEQDSDSLVETYFQAGLPGVINAVKDRINGNIDDDALYIVADPNFTLLAGNVNAWPASWPMDQEWGRLQVRRSGLTAEIEVRSFELPGGYHAMVGRDVSVLQKIGRLMEEALLWSAAIAVALGTVGALAVRSLFRSTIADVSATSAAIGAGDLTKRVRIAGQDDEFDRLAMTINDMLDRIGTLMDGVKQVSNAIAHDLRTPITRARTRLEDAMTHATGEAELRSALERAISDLDGIVGIFQALLRISEIEAGARRSHFARVDLSDLLGEMAELYEAVAEERGVTLRTDIAPGLALPGDRDMLQQAVANLLDNALKFSPEGGRILVRAAEENGVLAFEVCDSGPGIPAEERAHATERFFRGETARSTPGSGLGLALVQAVAQLHGGELALGDAEPGLRATLRFPMPVALASKRKDAA
jgi:signal transduction histidine kinase